MMTQLEKLAPSGFPSPAADFAVPNLDLNKFLVKHKSATFFMRVKTDKYRNFFIKKDDIIIVDRALMPNPGQLFLATDYGEFALHEYNGNNLRHKYSDYWGTVTYIIHNSRINA